MHGMIDRELHFVLRRFGICELHRVNIAENTLNRPANCGLLSTRSWYFVFPCRRFPPRSTVRGDDSRGQVTLECGRGLTSRPVQRISELIPCCQGKGSKNWAV
jgi:hypothetical protein